MSERQWDTEGEIIVAEKMFYFRLAAGNAHNYFARCEEAVRTSNTEE